MKIPVRILTLLSTLVLCPYAQTQTEQPQAANQLAAVEIAGPFITEALTANPSLQVSENRYQAARASLESVAVLPNPTAQITHFVEAIQTRTGPQRQAIMLQQPIPGPGKLSSRRDAARAQSESLWHAYAQAQLSLAESISKQVFEIAYLDKAIAIQEKKLTLLRNLEPIIEDRIRAGGTLADLLRLQVEIGRFEDQLARQQTIRLSTAAALEANLGRSTGRSIPSIDWQAPTKVVADHSQWLDAILNRSPQLSLLRSLEQSQDARQRIAQLAKRPDLSLGLNYIRTGDALDPAMTDSGKDPWAIMVGISLPIWKKSNNAYALQAAFEKDAISAQISQTELQLLATGRATIAQLQDAHSRIERFHTQLLPLARQVQETIRSNYESANANILDLIDSERTLLSLEIEYWRAAADAWQARWKLATLSGGTWLN